MLDLPRHYPALGEVLQAIDAAETAGPDPVRAELARCEALCRRILAENPVSLVGQAAAAKIAALLSGTYAPAPLVTQSRELHARLTPFVAPVTAEERALEQVIATFEDRFLAFGNGTMLPLIEGKLRAGAIDPGLAESQRAPFALVDRNRANPLRNALAAQRVCAERGESAPLLLLTQPDPLHFGYTRLSVTPQRDTAASGYSPLWRTMALADDLPARPVSEMDQLVGMHECWHVWQQVAWRQRNIEWFAAFHNPPPGAKARVIADAEFESHGLHVEAMDLMLDGMLRAQPAGTLCDHQAAMGRLHMPPERETMAKLFCVLAARYFPAGRAAEGSYPGAFKDAVRRICLELEGKDTYEMIGGQLRQLHLRR